MKVSATANGVITKAEIALVLLHAGEQALVFFSQSNMMTVKHNTKSADTKNAMKAAALAPLAVVAMSTKSLKLLGTLHSEDLRRLMATSTRRTLEMRL
jgi:hypothetical protein